MFGKPLFELARERIGAAAVRREAES